MPTRIQELERHWYFLRIHACVCKLDYDPDLYDYDQQHQPALVVLLAGKALPEWDEHGY